jgi:hypothetical protein
MAARGGRPSISPSPSRARRALEQQQLIMALANDTKPLNHLEEHILELPSASAGNIFGDDHLTETLGCCGSRGGAADRGRGRRLGSAAERGGDGRATPAVRARGAHRAPSLRVNEADGSNAASSAAAREEAATELGALHVEVAARSEDGRAEREALMVALKGGGCRQGSAGDAAHDTQ